MRDLSWQLDCQVTLPAARTFRSRPFTSHFVDTKLNQPSHCTKMGRTRIVQGATSGRKLVQGPRALKTHPARRHLKHHSGVRKRSQFKATEFSNQISNLIRLTQDANDSLLEARRQMELVEAALLDKTHHQSSLDLRSSQQSIR